MKILLKKELKLTASPLSFFFILFSLMTLIPGYPILVGAFFVCMGIFYTFQRARESNDVLFTALLPVAKADVVKARYLFVVFIQGASFLLSLFLTLIRMTLLKNAEVYLNNAMMNANLFYLSFILVLFSLFNAVFVGGYFKTAYKIGAPFLTFAISCLLLIGIFESLHFFPNLKFLNATDFSRSFLQGGVLVLGLLLYLSTFFLSMKKSMANFEKVDL